MEPFYFVEQIFANDVPNDSTPADLIFFRLSPGKVAIIVYVLQEWLTVAGSILYSAQSRWANSFGATTLQLLHDENVFVTATTDNAITERAGWVELGTNLIDYGEHHMGVIARPGETVKARIRKFSLASELPSKILVMIRGFFVNEDVFREALGASGVSY